MIEIHNLHKKFGKLKVLDGLDLTIDSGGIFAVLGPNGSGKTTLIKCLLGMVVSDNGKITMAGEDVKGKWSYRNDINYLPQIANFPANLTVIELINMVKNLRPKKGDEKELVELFGLESFLDKKLGTLSGGTKQKVNIVLTFMFDSNLIILDEPTTGLDPVSLIQLKKLLQSEKDKGKTILVTTHIMSLVDEIADSIVFLLDGVIYFKGTVEELKSRTGQNKLENCIANLIRHELV